MENQQPSIYKTIVSKFKKDFTSNGYTFKKTHYKFKCNNCNHEYIGFRGREIYSKCKYCSNISIVGVILKGGSTVIEEYKNENKVSHKMMCKLLCSCGNIFDRSTLQIKRNLKHNFSTVCKECISKKMSAIQTKGNIESFINCIMRDYKDGANARDLVFELNRIDFTKLIFSNCHYCNSKPSLDYKKRYKSFHTERNGIDRIDSSKGYIASNCISCCKKCNGMRMSLTQDEFIEQIALIYKHFIDEGSTTILQGSTSQVNGDGNISNLEIS